MRILCGRALRVLFCVVVVVVVVVRSGNCISLIREKICVRIKKEEKARKNNFSANSSQEEFSDDDDDVNDTYTLNKKQKETELFTDQRENGLSIERTFISNQRQENDAKRRRSKWPTIKEKFWFGCWDF